MSTSNLKKSFFGLSRSTTSHGKTQESPSTNIVYNSNQQPPMDRNLANQFGEMSLNNNYSSSSATAPIPVQRLPTASSQPYAKDMSPPSNAAGRLGSSGNLAQQGTSPGQAKKSGSLFKQITTGSNPPRTRHNSTVNPEGLPQPMKLPTANNPPTANNSSGGIMMETLPSSGGENLAHYAFQNANGTKSTVVFNADKVIGNGSFGVVFLAKILETGEPVAIKKVLQDKRFKNRELQIMKALKHRNIVEMKHCFYSTGGGNDRHSSSDDLYLNLVLEYVPDTVFRFCCQYTKNNEFMPMVYVKLFMFQLCRSLNYIHSLNICHRDIKPQNLLIDPVTGVLKLCDFGSAKQLVKGEPNVSYICSRYYRAPELIFGATNYTPAIDVWSSGCVLGELLIGQPLFPGESSVDQLVEIIRVLGTPTREEIEAMNKNYTEFKFPQVKPHPWSKVFADRKPAPPPEALDILTKFLQYNPRKRVKPLDALAHPFFDELRDPKTRLPNGRPLPPIFDLTPDELKFLSSPDLKNKIIPPHARKD